MLSALLSAPSAPLSSREALHRCSSLLVFLTAFCSLLAPSRKTLHKTAWATHWSKASGGMLRCSAIHVIINLAMPSGKREESKRDLGGELGRRARRRSPQKGGARRLQSLVHISCLSTKARRNLSRNGPHDKVFTWGKKCVSFRTQQKKTQAGLDTFTLPTLWPGLRSS